MQFTSNLQGMVSLLVGFQVAAFGWRINREISVGDAGRKTWFPVPDVINILSMLSVVFFCVLTPLAKGQFQKSSEVVLAASYILFVFHPISMAAHYRLWGKEGRSFYTKQNRDYPYITGQEVASVCLSLVSAGVGVWYFIR